MTFVNGVNAPSECPGKILDCLKKSSQPMGIKELEDAIGTYDYMTIWKHLKKLHESGKLVKTVRRSGSYKGRLDRPVYQIKRNV